jgi:hypothetical protein
MDDSYLALAHEAASLCGTISAQVAELEALEAQIAAEDNATVGGYGTTATSTPVKPLEKTVPIADVSAFFFVFFNACIL